MEINQSIQNLKDEELLEKTKWLAAEERKITAELLTYLLEVEKRLLFAARGFSSLFDYVTQELGYSESAAYRRISSMRLMAQLPEIEEQIKTGGLTLSQLTQAQRFFKQEEKNEISFPLEQKREIIQSLQGMSSRESERELASLSSCPESFLNKDQIKPVSQTHSEIRFVAEQNLVDQLDQIRGLLGHQDSELSIAELISKMAEITLEKLQSTRFAKLKSKVDQKKEKAEKSIRNDNTGLNPPLFTSDAEVEIAPNTPDSKLESDSKDEKLNSALGNRSRYIPAAIKRAVFERDGYRCTYEDPITKRRCGSDFCLQLDHIVPFSKNGPNTQENLRVRCFIHNQLHAIDSYGAAKMQEFRP